MSADRRDENDRVYGDRNWLEPDAEVAPDVISGGTDQLHGDTAFVPTEREFSDGDESATLKLVTIPDGRVVALAYSSLDQLVRCCGDQHPWVAFRSENIDALPGVTGADLLVWDEELPPELRRDGPKEPEESHRVP